MQLLAILEEFPRFLGDVPGDLGLRRSRELAVVVELAVARRRLRRLDDGLLDVFSDPRAPLLGVKSFYFAVDLLQRGPDAI